MSSNGNNNHLQRVIPAPGLIVFGMMIGAATVWLNTGYAPAVRKQVVTVVAEGRLSRLAGPELSVLKGSAPRSDVEPLRGPILVPDVLRLHRGACTMKVQAQAYETWRWDRDCETGAKSALGLNLTTTVEGPAPTCDGCFATLRLEAEDGTYATAFQHWTGDPRVTAFNQQRPAFAEKRRVFHTAVLPNVGRYDIEVEMHSIDYRGMLARGEGGHITKAKEITVQLTTSWINVPPQLAFRCTSGEAALGIRQNKKSADRLEPSVGFGYWARRNESMSWVDVRRPPTATADLHSGDEGDGVPLLAAELQMPDRERFFGALPGGLMVVGTSRPRTVFYDIVEMLGVEVKDAHKAHNDLSFQLGPNADGPHIVFAFHDVAEDMVPINFGQLDGPPTRTAQHLDSVLAKFGFCTPTSKPSAIIFTTGAGIISRALPPDELTRAADYTLQELLHLLARCRGPTRLIIASEMALHNHEFEPGSNSFRDNRNVAFNALVQDMASDLGLHFIDTHRTSLSARHTGDFAHYYDPHRPFVGDAVSKQVASMYLQAAWSAGLGMRVVATR